MDITDFPDAPRQGSREPLATIGNVAHLLDSASIRARYNVIKKKVEIDIPGFIGSADNRDNATMTHVISLAAENLMKTGLVPEYVNAVADRNEYNPVADWIDSQPWDGRDRLPEVFATVVQRGDYPVTLKEALVRKWLRSATAAAIVRGYSGRGVLTLQGPQGAGKTSWVRSLVSDRQLREQVVKVDHHMDGNSKDSVIGAITHWLVEIGELDSSFKKDIARLKGFLTSDADRIRRPYDRREAEYPRRTVFVATVNESNFLIDTTGNSRWWTIAVERLDFKHSIDMQQVFAQLAVQVRGGATWWLNADEDDRLEAWNSRHRALSVVAEMVQELIDLTSKHTPYLTATQVLQVAGIDKPSNPQAKECAAILRELFGDPKRVQGRTCWRVPMREPTGEELKPGPRGVNGAEPGEIF